MNPDDTNARIKSRIEGRQSARDCWSLVMVDDDDNFADAFVDEIRKISGIEIREKQLLDKAIERPPIARLGATVIPFGMYQGRTLDEIPLQYMDWLAKSQEEFYGNLRAYLRHPELKSRRSAEIPEDWL